MLQCAAVCCSVLQCAAVCCSVLQCVATCVCIIFFICSKAHPQTFTTPKAQNDLRLQHTATHYNTLQHLRVAILYSTHVFVAWCVCVCVCVFVCMFVCMRVSVSVSVSMCVCVSGYNYVYPCMCVRVEHSFGARE